MYAFIKFQFFIARSQAYFDKINVLYFLKHKQGALTRLNITFVLQFDSDGLWDVMSERRAIELVHEVMYIIS